MTKRLINQERSSGNDGRSAHEFVVECLDARTGRMRRTTLEARSHVEARARYTSDPKNGIHDPVRAVQQPYAHVLRTRLLRCEQPTCWCQSCKREDQDYAP